MRFVIALAVVSLALPAAAEPALVLLDPGHGGSNRGAYGPAIDRHEKSLALELARRTADELRRLGLRAALTRTTDRYLPLQQRVAIANRLGPAAFVSIHLNASESRSQRGFETYVLAAEHADREARRLALAARDGQTTASAAVMAAIFTDMAQRDVQRRSARLGLSIQQALARARGDADSRGLRQGPFDVLMGLRMPGALVELGFIDHVREGVELARPRFQQRLAQALARGIARFVRHGGAH